MSFFCLLFLILMNLSAQFAKFCKLMWIGCHQTSKNFIYYVA